MLSSNTHLKHNYVLRCFKVSMFKKWVLDAIIRSSNVPFDFSKQYPWKHPNKGVISASTTDMFAWSSSAMLDPCNMFFFTFYATFRSNYKIILYLGMLNNSVEILLPNASVNFGAADYFSVRHRRNQRSVIRSFF